MTTQQKQQQLSSSSPHSQHLSFPPPGLLMRVIEEVEVEDEERRVKLIKVVGTVE